MREYLTYTHILPESYLVNREASLSDLGYCVTTAFTMNIFASTGILGGGGYRLQPSFCDSDQASCDFQLKARIAFEHIRKRLKRERKGNFKLFCKVKV